MFMDGINMYKPRKYESGLWECATNWYNLEVKVVSNWGHTYPIYEWDHALRIGDLPTRVILKVLNHDLRQKWDDGPQMIKKICCSVETCWNHQSIFCCKWKYVPVGYWQCTKGWLIVLGRLNVKPGWIHPKQIRCRGVEICISPTIIGLVQGKI